MLPVYVQAPHIVIAVSQGLFHVHTIGKQLVPASRIDDIGNTFTDDPKLISVPEFADQYNGRLFYRNLTAWLGPSPSRRSFTSWFMGSYADITGYVLEWLPRRAEFKVHLKHGDIWDHERMSDGVHLPFGLWMLGHTYDHEDSMSRRDFAFLGQSLRLDSVGVAMDHLEVSKDIVIDTEFGYHTFYWDARPIGMCPIAGNFLMRADPYETTRLTCAMLKFTYQKVRNTA